MWSEIQVAFRKPGSLIPIHNYTVEMTLLYSQCTFRVRAKVACTSIFQARSVVRAVQQNAFRLQTFLLDGIMIVKE